MPDTIQMGDTACNVVYIDAGIGAGAMKHGHPVGQCEPAGWPAVPWRSQGSGSGEASVGSRSPVYFS